ncbi:MAG: hypothetical protein DMF68_22135 [Acidobacteria bacterium]|nr:MAG: hypothetical protein DMF68_22135 [Acidobacteriota bacterium]
MRDALEVIEVLQPNLAKLGDHLARIASGDVRAEVLEIEEQIEKLNRLKQKYESDLRNKAWQISNAKNKAERRYYEMEYESLGNWIHDTDTNIIELQSALKELKEFDYRNLYNELGVSPEAMRTNETDLRSIKNKADLVKSINPPPAPPPPKPKPKPEFDPDRIRTRKKAEIESQLTSLPAEEQRMIAATSDEEMKRRIANMYADKRAQLLNELRKWL